MGKVYSHFIEVCKELLRNGSIQKYDSEGIKINRNKSSKNIQWFPVPDGITEEMQTPIDEYISKLREKYKDYNTLSQIHNKSLKEGKTINSNFYSSDNEFYINGTKFTNMKFDNKIINQIFMLIINRLNSFDKCIPPIRTNPFYTKERNIEFEIFSQYFPEDPNPKNYTSVNRQRDISITNKRNFLKTFLSKMKYGPYDPGILKTHEIQRIPKSSSEGANIVRPSQKVKQITYNINAQKYIHTIPNNLLKELFRGFSFNPLMLGFTADVKNENRNIFRVLVMIMSSGEKPCSKYIDFNKHLNMIMVYTSLFMASRKNPIPCVLKLPLNIENGERIKIKRTEDDEYEFGNVININLDDTISVELEKTKENININIENLEKIDPKENKYGVIYKYGMAYNAGCIYSANEGSIINAERNLFYKESNKIQNETKRKEIKNLIRSQYTGNGGSTLYNNLIKKLDRPTSTFIGIIAIPFDLVNHSKYKRLSKSKSGNVILLFLFYNSNLIERNNNSIKSPIEVYFPRGRYISKGDLIPEKNLTFMEANLIRRHGFKFYQYKKSRYLLVSKPHLLPQKIKDNSETYPYWKIAGLHSLEKYRHDGLTF